MAEPFPPTPGVPGIPDVGAILGGKYAVLRRIGEGGMGMVVEAENTVTGKRVAIKWMHPQVAARPEAAERFLREARASARVRHPNVVDVYDVVHEGNSCFLVMELLDGEPLSTLLERGGMPAHELIALLLEAMRGVAAAHKQGVIHRDIKPDNIFLAEETDRKAKIPKVLDFGISKVTGSDAMSLTRTGATLGTPMYMSFEQICGVKDIDARTDVYAFGVILYEALTGHSPFQAESFPELIVKISNSRPTPPKHLRPDIPHSLDRLVQRAMAKEREDRVPSLEALIRELEPFSTAHSFRAQMTAEDTALPRVMARSDAPPKTPAPALVVHARESAPAPTPMQANVPIPPPPRRRDALPWLIVGGAIATLLGALSLFSSSPEGNPAAGSQAPGMLQPATPTAGGATGASPQTVPGEPGALKPAAAISGALGDGNSKLPVRQAPPPAAGRTRQPVPQAAAARPPAPAAAHKSPAAAQTSRAGTNTAPSTTTARPAPDTASGRPTGDITSDENAAGTPWVRPAASKPQPVPPAQDPRRFRAGRPRTEDF